MPPCRLVPSWVVTLALVLCGCGGSGGGSTPGKDGGATGTEGGKPAAEGGRPASEGGKPRHDSGGSTTLRDAQGDSTVRDAVPADVSANIPKDAAGTFDAVLRDAYVGIDAGTNTCTKASLLHLVGPHTEFTATTVGGTHEMDPPCATGTGPDAFFKLEFSEPVFLYADTFGATWDTVLFLLSDSCTPLTASTTPGDAVCSAGACETKQSQLVALLQPGVYVLGLTGAASSEGSAVVQLEYAVAASGTEAQLPKGTSVQSGTTEGAVGNIDSESPACIAAGPENGYWWTSCPKDTGGELTASTCDGASWETVLEVEIPASTPYACSLDTCGMQSAISGTIPPGAGLRLLLVDGEAGNSAGPYTMQVSRP